MSNPFWSLLSAPALTTECGQSSSKVAIALFFSRSMFILWSGFWHESSTYSTHSGTSIPQYSQHPKSGRVRFLKSFLSGSRMVQFSNDIWIPDKFVQFSDASLDHFIHKNIFVCIKRSRLAGPFENPMIFVRFSNAKWRPKHSKPDSKSVLKMTIWNQDGRDFGCWLYTTSWWIGIST
jgi:hypothetical protein